MYTQHFNLQKLPFENVPDPEFFYDQGDHARIRKQISGSLQSGRGLIVVTGPIGSGKTTLSQMIKADFPENIKVIWMAEPPANSIDLYLFLAQELGLHPMSPEKTFVMRDIRNALLEINAAGQKCLIIIDESHLMSDDVINGIRLLNNLEEGSIKLIQLLLLGQEELLEMINRPALEPFKQRIAALETLGRLNSDATKKYIQHRLKIAGGSRELISDTGWEALAIAFQAGGTPRTINSLCDRAFGVAFEREKSSVDAHDIYEATQRLGLRTDVFHYIISLKSQERKNREAHATSHQESTAAAYQEPSPVNTETGIPEVKVPVPETPPPASEYTAPYFKQNTKQAAHISATKPGNMPYDDSRMHLGDPATIYEDIANEIKAKYTQRNLRAPIAFLLISLASLAVSILFFCHQTDSTGFSDCLIDLFNF